MDPGPRRRIGTPTVRGDLAAAVAPCRATDGPSAGTGIWTDTRPRVGFGLSFQRDERVSDFYSARSGSAVLRRVDRLMPQPNFLNRTLWIDDNLPVLRGVNSECIDLVCLDPPFNSKRFYNAPLGSDAAGAQFDDTWTMDGVKTEWIELQEAADPALYHTVVSAGLSAGDAMQAYMAFMAPRLAEVWRVLKPNGSMYLHCDPHASHYLKQLCDCIFGQRRFRNEIVWKRTSTKSLGTQRYARDSDRIFYYTKSKPGFVWNQQYRPHDPEHVRKSYRHDDADGLGPYATEQLTGGKAGGPAAYLPFKGTLPSEGAGVGPAAAREVPRARSGKTARQL